MAAELSRRRAPRQGNSHFSKDDALSITNIYKWKENEVRVVMGVLASDIDTLCMLGKDIIMDKSMSPVNPWTYIQGSSQLCLMINLLERLLNAAEWKCRLKVLRELEALPAIVSGGSNTCSSCGSS